MKKPSSESPPRPSAEEIAKTLEADAATLSSAREKVVASRMKLFLTKPFFSTLAMSLNYIPTTWIPSWAVTPTKVVYYNPSLVLEESLVEGVMSIIHEILHIVRGDVFLKSFFDKPGENQKLGNVAMDLKVNWAMTSSDYSLPDNGKWIFADPKTAEFKYKDHQGLTRKLKRVDERSWRDLYEELKRYVGSEGDGGANPGIDDHSLWGLSPDGTPLDEAAKSKLIDAVNVQIAAAAAAAHARGKLPAGVAALVNDALCPKLDYRALLRQFLANNMPFDYSFTRRDRRFVPFGINFPGADRECLEGVVHIDSSGSVWGKRDEFVAEFKGMLEAFHNVKLTLIVCDAAIHYVGEFTSADLSQLKMSGAGGTSHKPVVDWINENMPQARVFISLTDGISDIQDCYHELPATLSKFIILDQGTLMGELSQYGQTVCITQ